MLAVAIVLLVLACDNPVLNIVCVGLQLPETAGLTRGPLADVVDGAFHARHISPPQPVQPTLRPDVTLRTITTVSSIITRAIIAVTNSAIIRPMQCG